MKAKVLDGFRVSLLWPQQHFLEAICWWHLLQGSHSCKCYLFQQAASVCGMQGQFTSKWVHSHSQSQDRKVFLMYLVHDAHFHRKKPLNVLKVHHPAPGDYAFTLYLILLAEAHLMYVSNVWFKRKATGKLAEHSLEIQQNMSAPAWVMPLIMWIGKKPDINIFPATHTNQSKRDVHHHVVIITEVTNSTVKSMHYFKSGTFLNNAELNSG